ncbi:hypothetical protein EJD97_020525, partial [Solanum chilense]
KKDSICWKSVKTRLGRQTMRRIIVVTTGRHGLCRPILVQFLLLLSSLPSTEVMTDRQRHNGPSRVSVPKTLELLEYGYWDYLFDLHDELSGWTVMATMVRQAFRNPTLCQTSQSSFSSCTTLPPTDRHEHVGPSQAP